MVEFMFYSITSKGRKSFIIPLSSSVQSLSRREGHVEAVFAAVKRRLVQYIPYIFFAQRFKEAFFGGYE